MNTHEHTHTHIYIQLKHMKINDDNNNKKFGNIIQGFNDDDDYY